MRRLKIDYLARGPFRHFSSRAAAAAAATITPRAIVHGHGPEGGRRREQHVAARANGVVQVGEPGVALGRAGLAPHRVLFALRSSEQNAVPA